MWKERDSSKYSLAPSHTLYLTCLMWGGWAIYEQHRLDLVLLNGLGVLFAVGYGTIHWLLARSERQRVKTISVAAATTLFALLLYGICFMSDAQFVLPSRLIAGTATAVINIAVFAAPASATFRAVVALDASRVPTLFTWICLMGAVNWGLFAIMTDDMFMLVPNIIGGFLSVTQLVALAYIQICRQGSNASKEAKVAPATDSSTTAAMEAGQLGGPAAFPSDSQGATASSSSDGESVANATKEKQAREVSLPELSNELPVRVNADAVDSLREWKSRDALVAADPLDS